MKQNTRLQSYFTDPTLQRSFRGHKDAITTCLFNPNMKQVISGSDDGNLILWNFKPQMRPHKFIGHKGPIHDVAISPNGSIIASASGDETVRLWSNSVNGTSQTVKAHSGPVKSVDFNNDGKLLLTASNDKIIKIINVADRKFQASLVGHTNWVKCARFSPDSRLVGSASDDHTVRLWDVAQKVTIHTFIDHLEDVNAVRFHPDGTCIASGSVDKKIKIWDIRSKRLIQHYDAHAASVTSLSFHPSGNYLISSSVDSTLKVWDLKMGQILYTLYGHEGPATCVSSSNCGDFFCSGGSDSILMVWKSNVRNMDEEMESLSKTEMSKMKSNRRKILEDTNVGSDGQRKKISNNNPNVSKFKVTQVKQTEQPDLKNNNVDSSTSSNMFNKLPDELSSTFEKMISQLDIIAKTMKIMDQRIATVENQVTEIFQSKRKKNDLEYQGTFKSVQAENYEENYADNNFQNFGGDSQKLDKNTYKKQYVRPDADPYIQRNEFRMSQGSSHRHTYNYNQNENYVDTFKHGGSGITQNVFNQNLGQTAGYNSYGYNREEELPNDEGNKIYAINNNDLEIFEDKNNHIEELEVGLQQDEIVDIENLENENHRNFKNFQNLEKEI